MLHPRTALVIALSLGACAHVKQAPPAFRWSAGVKPGAYFPLAAGTAWSYDALDPGSGRKVFVVSRVLAKDGPRAVFALDPDPLSYEDTGEAIVSFPSRKTVLQAPIARGTRWPAGAGTATITAVDAVVDAPAGRYLSCVSVEELAPDRRIVTTFAPGVGPAQIEIYYREAGREILVSRALLRSYHDAATETP
jgi:hypothetical protein